MTLQLSTCMPVSPPGVTFAAAITNDTTCLWHAVKSHELYHDSSIRSIHSIVSSGDDFSRTVQLCIADVLLHL